MHVSLGSKEKIDFLFVSWKRAFRQHKVCTVTGNFGDYGDKAGKREHAYKRVFLDICGGSVKLAGKGRELVT